MIQYGFGQAVAEGQFLSVIVHILYEKKGHGLLVRNVNVSSKNFFLKKSKILRWGALRMAESRDYSTPPLATKSYLDKHAVTKKSGPFGPK